jgi:hydroxymethylbilane synthase
VKPLRIGSRGSALALWQANFVRARLAQSHGLEAEVVVLKTAGDRFDQKQINQIGLKGVFIKELEDALLDRRVDLAVHSMKDVPTEIPAGLAFPAITQREDARDCLVSRTGAGLDGLLRGARVGTSSLRRQSQLRHHRPDLQVCELRGNVDTRLAKLERGDCDAIVLAKAGLERLGWTDRITEVLSPEIMLPAAGQGALGVEARADDLKLCEYLGALDDSATRAAVSAERTLLVELQGGCQVPLGAWARIEQSRLVMEACVASPDGADYLRRRAVGSVESPEALGRELAAALLDAGADRILKLIGRAISGR